MDTSIFVTVFSSVAQAAPASAKVGVKAGLLDAVLGANPFVQFLLLLMVSLSIGSWAIMFTKRSQLRALREANSKFNEQFWKAGSLEDVFEKIGDGKGSNAARIFKQAFLELQRIADSGLAGAKSAGEAAPRLSGLDNLERTIRRSIEAEVSAAESRLNFLATVGSTAPFIGLLGTVVGIMSSFSSIAASGSASLAVVAPGISEALFATAVGLFAALPAVAAYNLFVADVRRMEMDLNGFGSDFLNIAKRNFFKDA
ncbi:MAG: MotA/TolQ/ExbB proton channel family protein [Bdellovibrionota bacterium]